MMLSAQTGLARYQSRDVPPRRVGYKSRPGITTYSIQILCRTAFLFQVAYPGNKIINYNNHTAQGENNEHNSRPCSPITHIPHVFLPNPYLIPTQPEPDPSLAYVAAYMPYTHSLHIKTLTLSNGTQSCYTVDVARHDLCRTLWLPKKRSICEMVSWSKTSLNMHTHTHTYETFQMFDHGLPEIMSGALQTSQLSDKGREPKGRVDYA